MKAVSTRERPGLLASAPLFDALLNRADDQFGVQLGHKLVTKLEGFGKVVTGVDVYKGKRYGGRRKSFFASQAVSIESFPPEKRRQGRSNCAAASLRT